MVRLAGEAAVITGAASGVGAGAEKTGGALLFDGGSRVA